MYRVIAFFTDLKDRDYPYNVGDIFPRPGLEVKQERYAELSGSDNKRGIPLIEPVEEKAGAGPVEADEPEHGIEPTEPEEPKKAPAKKSRKK